MRIRISFFEKRREKSLVKVSPIVPGVRSAQLQHDQASLATPTQTGQCARPHIYVIV